MSQDKPQAIRIDAGTAQLSGRFYPPQGVARAHAVLHGATGVPQQYYRHFAVWAAARGIGVLTYDYRDCGDSQHGHMRDSTATYTDWAVHDQGAAERALAALVPDGPLWVIGHSIGGLGVPFRSFDPRFERITTIGAGMNHFSDHPWRYRPKALAFWFLLGPVGTRLAGYLPGRRMMLGADLPAGVYWQWRRWCTRRSFYFPEIGTDLPPANFDTGPPLRIVAMGDDPVIPPISVRRYAGHFPRAEYEQIQPGDYGLKSLGHIEVFSRRNTAVWPAITGV